MVIWYCEKCGKRIPDEDLEPGAADNGGVTVRYCKLCAPAMQPRATVTGEARRKPPVSGVSHRPATKAAMAAAPVDRAPAESASPERPGGRGTQQAASNLPLYIGAGAAGLVLLFVVAYAVSGPSGTEAKAPLQAAAATDSPGRAAVASSSGSGRSSGGNSSLRAEQQSPAAAAAGSPAPRDAEKPATSALAPKSAASSQRGALNDEDRAQAAFEALQKDLNGLIRDDVTAKTKAIEAYLKEYGNAMVASRARRLLDEIRKPAPQPQPPTPSVAPPAAPGENAETALKRGQQKQAANDLQGALADYDRALELRPQYPEALVCRADVKQVLYDLEGALADCEKANSSAWQVPVIQAIAYYGLGKEAEYQAAVARAKGMVNQPQQLEAFIIPRARNARIVYKGKSLEGKEPATAEEFSWRGQYRFVAKRPDEALKDLETALKLDPTLGPKGLLATLAQVADSKKDWKAKLDYNRRWALSAPDSPEALNGHAWELLTSPDEKLRDVKTALALASKAAEASKPESPAILDTLALAYARNGKFREAVDTQQRAIALLPPNMTPAQRKEYEDHLREFRDGLERQPR